jgi:hypothetical protein
LDATGAEWDKSYAFAFVLAGILLLVRNYRGRERVGVLRARISSNEFSSLLVAIVLTALAFVALALFPLTLQSTATLEAVPGNGRALNTAPYVFAPPNLGPPGIPRDVGDLFQISTLFFVLIPVAIVAVPLLMRRNRYRGVVEAALAIFFSSLAVVADISTGLFFLPTTVAMLSAAAFAQRQ